MTQPQALDKAKAKKLKIKKLLTNSHLVIKNPKVKR